MWDYILDVTNKLYLPALVWMILIIRKFIFYPFIDFFQGEVSVLFATQGHLDEMHITVGGSFLSATFCTYLEKVE